MDNSIIQIVEEKLSQPQEQWLPKAQSFINNTENLNSTLLIDDQLQKIMTVGLKSIETSVNVSQKLTKEVLSLIDNELSAVTTGIAKVTDLFNALTNALTQKKSFFTRKDPEEIFFEMFSQEENNINNLVRSLSIKEIELEHSKESIDRYIDYIIDAFYLLERDIKLLKLVEQKLGRSFNENVVSVFNKYHSDIKIKQTDLLTHQQIMMQKFAALKILQNNIANCNQNIKIISKVTFSVLQNTVELKKIISMSKSSMSSEELTELKKLKESFTAINTDFKIIASQPFATHIANH